MYAAQHMHQEPERRFLLDRNGAEVREINEQECWYLMCTIYADPDRIMDALAQGIEIRTPYGHNVSEFLPQ